MDGRFSNNPFANEQEDTENSPENSGDSPRSGTMFSDSKMATTSSSKKSRRAVQKRVVSVPIRDVEGSRLKGDSAPPSDSWAWRKYGQKPIKGSPYPRGYYRCSSSKGCPARKQVERSRVDPTMLMVTYSCEHNHPSPAAKNNNHRLNHQTAAVSAATTSTAVGEVTSVSAATSNSDDEKTTVFENQLEIEGRFANLGEDCLVNAYQFKWFSDLESTSSTLLESPILGGGDTEDGGAIFSMREEDESLFADLGELPECSLVFRRGVLETEEEGRRCNFSPWCGTTG